MLAGLLTCIIILVNVFTPPDPRPPTPPPVVPDPIAKAEVPAVNNRVAAHNSNAKRLPKATGVATWYDNGNGVYAAAGPKLRIGHWRGRTVSVCSRANCFNVRLVDWCACGHGHIIDLSPAAFRLIGTLSQGVVKVTVSW